MRIATSPTVSAATPPTPTTSSGPELRVAPSAREDLDAAGSVGREADASLVGPAVPRHRGERLAHLVRPAQVEADAARLGLVHDRRGVELEHDRIAEALRRDHGLLGVVRERGVEHAHAEVGEESRGVVLRHRP